MVYDKNLVVIASVVVAVFVIIQFKLGSISSLKDLPAIFVVISVITFYAYDWHQKQKSQNQETENKYKGIEDTMTTNKKQKLGNVIVRSNREIVNAIIGLQVYLKADKDAFKQFYDALIDFYTIYGKLLLGKITLQENWFILIEKRRTCLNYLASMYAQSTSIHHNITYQTNVQTIILETQKAISTIKKKNTMLSDPYTSLIKAPFASNMYNESSTFEFY